MTAPHQHPKRPAQHTKTRLRWRLLGSALGALLAGSALAAWFKTKPQQDRTPVQGLEVPLDWQAPATAPSFAATWRDGKAEIAAYELGISRYGATRQGRAIMIFVTEPFSLERRLKIEGPASPQPGSRHASEVMKLNLIREFPTGIYNYSTMTSAFVTTMPSAAGPDGSTLKVTFSAQEWCGHAFETLLPQPKSVRRESHSYFGNEGDRTQKLQAPPESLLADSLFHWARDLAHPALAPGQTKTARLLHSLLEVRFGHIDPSFVEARLHSNAQTEELAIAGRTWLVRRKEVSTADGRHYRFWVEVDMPHRIVRWTMSGAEGAAESAELRGSERLAYWDLKDNADRSRLSALGLDPNNF